MGGTARSESWTVETPFLTTDPPHFAPVFLACARGCERLEGNNKAFLWHGGALGCREWSCWGCEGIAIHRNHCCFTL